MNDIMQILHIFGPPPPHHCPIHATYQNYHHVLDNPPTPSSA